MNPKTSSSKEPGPYDAVLGGHKKLLPVFVRLLQRPRDCFFNSVADIYSPGWVIGEVSLPCSAGYRGDMYLIRDGAGETWWIYQDKVYFRGQTHRFDTDLGKSFKWNSIAELNQLPLDYQQPSRYKAEAFAIAKHAHQKYGEHPYEYHLHRVLSVLVEFEHTDNQVIVAGWLHDTLEDTETTYEMLVSEFGKEVADIVQAATSEPGKNREERFRNTAPKIQSNKKALIVKLADRIANTEASLESNSKLYNMYVKEFPLFKELLYNPQDIELMPMWNRLESSNK